MKRSLKNTALAGLASAAVAASMVAITSTSASAISKPFPCPNQAKSEFLEVEWQTAENPGEWDCFANGGEHDFGQTVSVNEIWTGNNSVQYFANGTWQPAQAFPHNADFPYWGNPLQIQKIRIV